MQNSNLSSKIFPIIREDWLEFIKIVEKNLQEMITTLNNDKHRIRNLERIISKIKEVSELSKDNIEEILNYRELFMYIDNSLESSFDALEFFKSKDDFDNEAVKAIYERIVNSPKIILINSEYNSLSIKVEFDKDRIKALGDLISGSKIDYRLITDLANKYKLSNDKKKNILLYPVVMLSIKQNEVKNSKEIRNKNKEEKQKFYHERFNELCQVYRKKKENLKDLLLRCFNVRASMRRREIDMYNSYANNPDEIKEYDFDDEIKFKIYTLSFFKIKKDIETFIDGISDLSMDDVNLDDELAFFGELINEFDRISNVLEELIKNNTGEIDLPQNNVFFALDAFNRLIIGSELLSSRNKNSIRVLLQKAIGISNSKIEGVKTNHMLGVAEEEKALGKNISMLTTSKIKLAYIMVGKSILIIDGTDNNNDRFDKIVKLAINKNLMPIRKQIELISNEDLDYMNLQNEIIDDIMEKDKSKQVI